MSAIMETIYQIRSSQSIGHMDVSLYSGGRNLIQIRAMSDGVCEKSMTFTNDEAALVIKALSALLEGKA